MRSTQSPHRKIERCSPAAPSVWRLLLTAFLLTLAGCGGGAEGQVLFRGRCPKVPPMRGFEPNRFLGRWYEIERFFVSYEGLAGTCWVENYLYDKHSGFFTRLDWKDHLTGRVFNIENGLTFDDYEPAVIHYVVQRPSIPILQGEYRILATDYYNYALAWQCDELPLGTAHTQILWFLSKNQHPTYETVMKAKYLATSLGLDASLLQKQDRRDCPP
ncbi:apolipoprotein D-like [Penaeus japonicus]|uniref:apolipoprotein D-like n=1 Tax=Penaeus japonicus TaxID=27405 RepID=UPI001C711994|nr:apolipoprotein D-like [Penaeus japonicus]